MAWLLLLLASATTKVSWRSESYAKLPQTILPVLMSYLFLIDSLKPGRIVSP